VLALDIDDDPKALDPALKELRGALFSVAARNFAYDRVPLWLCRPTGSSPPQSEMFDGPPGFQDAWLEQATSASQRATSQTLSTLL
jgi:hypothetical protein